jgi:hypothetical protein
MKTIKLILKILFFWLYLPYWFLREETEAERIRADYGK